MGKGHRHVAAADVLYEAADQDDHVADEGERNPNDGGDEASEPETTRKPRRKARVALAADRHVGKLPQPALLKPERDEGEAQEHHRQHRCAAGVVLRPCDSEKCLGGEHLEVAREHDRIGKIGKALHEAQQECVGQRRPQERPSDRAEHAGARGAQGLCRLLEGRADGHQRAVEKHERDRRERQQLRQRDSGQAVDPARPGNAEPGVEPASNETGAPEQHDDRQCDHEWRRHDRQDRQEPQQACVAPSAALYEQGQDEPQQRREQAHDHRKQRGIDGHAAARAASQATHAPDVGSKEPRRHQRRREPALGIFDRR